MQPLFCFLTGNDDERKLVVADSERKKGESLLASTPVVVLSAILGRTPTAEEYRAAVQGIQLTEFAPPEKEMATVAPDYSTGNVEFRVTK